ncbi:DUF317 domain-containing protein [Streptomyces albus]|uniref:DUF317 domain-containing protein n=1 Tax=Streptomyces albus TaxID=1888 RepID=UPI003B98380B
MAEYTSPVGERLWHATATATTPPQLLDTLLTSLADSDTLAPDSAPYGAEKTSISRDGPSISQPAPHPASCRNSASNSPAAWSHEPRTGRPQPTGTSPRPRTHRRHRTCPARGDDITEPISSDASGASSPRGG